MQAARSGSPPPPTMFLDAAQLQRPGSPNPGLRPISFLRRAHASRENLTAGIPKDEAAELNKLVSNEAALLLAKSRRRLAANSQLEGSIASDQVALDSPGLYLRLEVRRLEPALADQVMKADAWEGIHILPQPSPFVGAPNWREVGNGSDGLSQSLRALQPTMNAVRAMMDSLTGGEHPRFRHVIFVNLREEPVAYVRDADKRDFRTYAPREPGSFNVNLSHFQLIESFDLEDIEQRLKADIIAQAHHGNGEFCFYHQLADQSNTSLCTPLLSATDESAVQTPREVYDVLRIDEHRPLTFHRIPITDECAPDVEDLDAMVDVLKAVPPRVAVVLNCQMGRGRTTTGLVIAMMIFDGRAGRIPTSVPPECDYAVESSRPCYERGEFSIVCKLMESIEEGNLVKYWVDSIIDHCAAMQHLRLAILEARTKAQDPTQTPAEQDRMTERALRYIERYWWLLVFGSYVRLQAPQNFQVPFSSWMRSRWGLRRILRKLTLN